MNYTAFTAIIITLHHISALSSVVLGTLMMGPIYWFFLRKRKHRLTAFLLTLVISLVLASIAVEKILVRTPISVEIITAG